MKEQNFGMPEEPRVFEGEIEILPPEKRGTRPEGNRPVWSKNLFLTQVNHYYEGATNTQEIIYIIEKEPPEDNPWVLLFEDIFRSGEAACKAVYNYRQMCRQQKALEKWASRLG